MLNDKTITPRFRPQKNLHIKAAVIKNTDSIAHQITAFLSQKPINHY